MYAGVDFSLNSSAVCVSIDNKYSLFNFINTSSFYNKKGDKVLEKWKIHSEINSFVNIVFSPREVISKDYAESQIDKILSYEALAESIVSILPIGCKVGLEGFSYASKGQGYIDLIMAQSILRLKIVSRSDLKLIVIPPSNIKKFYSGKGNADKKLMFDSFKISDFNNPLFEYVNTFDVVKPNGDILKPVDDLIDAIAICKYTELL